MIILKTFQKRSFLKRRGLIIVKEKILWDYIRKTDELDLKEMMKFNKKEIALVLYITVACYVPKFEKQFMEFKEKQIVKGFN
jgi:hypothetical protein